MLFDETCKINSAKLQILSVNGIKHWLVVVRQVCGPDAPLLWIQVIGAITNLLHYAEGLVHEAYRYLSSWSVGWQ